MQRPHHGAALDDRDHLQAVLGAAILLQHHQVLGDVHQAPGEVTGVGRLEGGIRKTLARAVGRDEVLDDVQAFTEIRGDGRLDDGTVRLGHQATHARQLADLGRRTTRA